METPTNEDQQIGVILRMAKDYPDLPVETVVRISKKWFEIKDARTLFPNNYGLFDEAYAEEVLANFIFG